MDGNEGLVQVLKNSRDSLARALLILAPSYSLESRTIYSAWIHNQFLFWYEVSVAWV